MFSMNWVLKTILGTEDPPNKVLEAKPDQFSSRGICHREDGLILYLPNTNNPKRDKLIFEIVLHRPASEGSHQTFSLYRAKSRDEAELKFLTLKDKLPEFIEITSVKFCNEAGLQKLCDVLFEHPRWTWAHLAAHFGLHDLINNPKIKNYLNSIDENDGMSPLQIAIVSKNLKTVQVMVDAGCSLEHLDHNDNSVYHFAASTSKEIMNVLTQGTPPSCLSARNKEGYTPLHIACLTDKPDCVRALITAGADVNITATTNAKDVKPSYVGSFLQNTPNNALYTEDMKNGGTPLHWACSKSVVETLVDMNCHIDYQNFQKRTALHVMVLRKRLDCVVALLSRFADPDIGDQDGNRPIHFAALKENAAIIQALIVFGADLDVVNNNGETARHIIGDKWLYNLAAVGAKRCKESTIGCRDGCKFDGVFEGFPPLPVREPTNRDELNHLLMNATMEIITHRNEFPKNGRLLCLDGGGIRGLILVQCLIEIEKVVKKPIVHCFDWIAGTSTGGILALAIAKGKMMRECLSMYFRLKEYTFIGSRPYRSEYLENVLKETFGANCVMADIKYPRVMVTGTLADRKPVELHLFRNYQSANTILNIEKDKLPPPEKQFLWEVARATGAAPTYFRSFGSFLDGGLIANNPTLDAMTEIHEHSLALKAMQREEEAAPVSLVVSIGTGHVPVTEIENIDIFRTDSLIDHAKLAFGATKFGALLVDQATASDGRVVDRARSWCSSIGVPYFRFNPQMSEEFELDEKNDESLCKMLWECRVYMRKNYSNIIELASLLNKD